ncbi:MAG: L,D-transpeptidase family protein [Verrucomicrobiota bacterium]
MMNKWRKAFAVFFLGMLGVLHGSADQFQIPDTTRQLILCITDDWSSSKGDLTLWERQENEPWNDIEKADVRLGKKGIAWGLGIHPEPLTSHVKREGDGRAPAGVFEIGGVYGYGTGDSVERNERVAYKQVGEGDLWVEDVTSVHYNRYLRWPADMPMNAWSRKQQMRLNDEAHSLKLFIGHNAGPDIVPGRGSAIFFHIWREEGQRPSIGCTTMGERALRKLIAWIDPEKEPLYVLLPKDEYEKLRWTWLLP